MKKLILSTVSVMAVLSMLLITTPCFTQQKDSSATSKQPNLLNEWMIKFAPLSVLESDGGLSFSVEYLTARQRIGYQLEAQPVLFSIDKQAGAGDANAPKDVLQSGPVRGIKLRSEVRYYLNRLKPSRFSNSSQYKPGTETPRKLPTCTYLAVAFMYKQTRQQRTNEFNINGSGTQPDYQLRAEYTDVKRVTQFECKFGVVRPLKGEHWLADVYFGLGIRRRKIFYQNLPPGASEPRRNGFFGGSSGTQSETFPSFPFGIRIVYRL